MARRRGESGEERSLDHGRPLLLGALLGRGGGGGIRALLAVVPQLPVSDVVAMFDVAVAEAAQPVAAACKAVPSNAWELLSMLTPAITTAEAPEVYNAVCGFLCAVGALLSTSKTSAYSVLTDYALPFFLPTLHGSSTHKIAAMLRVVYALVPATPSRSC